MATIITDPASLRQVSRPVELTDPETLDKDDLQPLDLVSRETEGLIKDLLETLPEEYLGLAAPQIGEFERIFVARLSSGLFVFINPHLTKSDTAFASTEGCLSLPGITQCVSRAVRTSIKADLIYCVQGDEFIVVPTVGDMYSLDSAITQHEYEHLEGVLLTDHADAPESQQEFAEKDAKRRQRITVKRQIRVAKTQHATNKKVTKINPKRAAKLKKIQKQNHRLRRKRVEIEEYQKAIKEGTINPSIP